MGYRRHEWRGRQTTGCCLSSVQGSLKMHWRFALDKSEVRVPESPDGALWHVRCLGLLRILPRRRNSVVLVDELVFLVTRDAMWHHVPSLLEDVVSQLLTCAHAHATLREGACSATLIQLPFIKRVAGAIHPFAESGSPLYRKMTARYEIRNVQVSRRHRQAPRSCLAFENNSAAE